MHWTLRGHGGFLLPLAFKMLEFCFQSLSLPVTDSGASLCVCTVDSLMLPGPGLFLALSLLPSYLLRSPGGLQDPLGTDES